MKYNDIKKIFSQIIAEKLNDHYMIDPEFMRGFQGEIAKIDYIDLAGLSACPHHRYRLLLENETENIREYHTRVEKIIISIYYYDNVKNESTLWNNDGKVVFKKTYYKIDKDYYVSNRQELENVLKLRWSRQKVRDSYDEDVVKTMSDSKYVEFAVRYVKHKVYRFAKEVRFCKMSKGNYFISYKKKNGQTVGITLHLKKSNQSCATIRNHNLFYDF